MLYRHRHDALIQLEYLQSTLVNSKATNNNSISTTVEIPVVFDEEKFISTRRKLGNLRSIPVVFASANARELRSNSR